MVLRMKLVKGSGTNLRAVSIEAVLFRGVSSLQAYSSESSQVGARASHVQAKSEVGTRLQSSMSVYWWDPSSDPS